MTELLGYAKTDKNGKQYFFIRSTEEDTMINLKEVVMFIHPFQTKEGKDKVRLIVRPADKVKETL